MLTKHGAVILNEVKNLSRAALITLLRQRAVHFECEVPRSARDDTHVAAQSALGRLIR
jgi:hypothetical protein